MNKLLTAQLLLTDSTRGSGSTFYLPPRPPPKASPPLEAALWWSCPGQQARNRRKKNGKAFGMEGILGEEYFIFFFGEEEYISVFRGMLSFLRAGCGACAVCVCCTQLCVCSSAAVCGLDGGTLVLVMAEWTMCTLGACCASFGNPGHVRMRVTRDVWSWYVSCLEEGLLLSCCWWINGLICFRSRRS